MKLNDAAGQRQAETEAWNGVAFLCTVEGLENIFDLFRGDAPAIVRNRDPDLIPRYVEPYSGLVIIGIFASVGNDISDGGEQELFIAEYEQIVLCLRKVFEVQDDIE